MDSKLQTWALNLAFTSSGVWVCYRNFTLLDGRAAALWQNLCHRGAGYTCTIFRWQTSSFLAKLLHLKKLKLGEKGRMWGKLLLRTLFRADAFRLATVPETTWGLRLGHQMEEGDRRGKMVLWWGHYYSHYRKKRDDLVTYTVRFYGCSYPLFLEQEKQFAA